METLLCYLGWDVAIDTYLLGQHVSLPLGTANVVPPLAAISVVAFCSPSNPDVDALAAPRLHRFDTVLVTVISACAASTAALMHLALTLTPDSLVPRIDRYCAYPGCLAESFSVQMLMGEWSIGLLYAALSIMATSLIGTLPGAAATGIAYAITVAVGSCPQIAVISPLTVVTAPIGHPGGCSSLCRRSFAPSQSTAIVRICDQESPVWPRIWEYSPIVLDAKSGLCQRIALQSFRLHTIRPS